MPRMRSKVQEGAVSDGEIALIEEPTPVVVERVADGWAYTRPTDGPHKGRLLVVRDVVVKKN